MNAWNASENPTMPPAARGAASPIPGSRRGGPYRKKSHRNTRIPSAAIGMRRALQTMWIQPIPVVSSSRSAITPPTGMSTIVRENTTAPPTVSPMAMRRTFHHGRSSSRPSIWRSTRISVITPRDADQPAMKRLTAMNAPRLSGSSSATLLSTCATVLAMSAGSRPVSASSVALASLPNSDATISRTAATGTSAKNRL